TSVATASINEGRRKLFFNGFSSSIVIMVSPQKQFIKMRSKEYKTKILDKKASASNKYALDSTVPWPMSILQIKPLNGGIPASDKVTMQKSQPRMGYLRIIPLICLIRVLPVNMIIVPIIK